MLQDIITPVNSELDDSIGGHKDIAGQQFLDIVPLERGSRRHRHGTTFVEGGGSLERTLLLSVHPGLNFLFIHTLVP